MAVPVFVMEAIQQDAVFFLRLIRTLIGHPDSGLIAPAVIPFASLFVVESDARLAEHGCVRASAFARDELGSIRAARHRVKMLLSKKSDVSQLVADFHAIVRDERERFVGAHRGWLGPLKRWVQPDLGISLIDGEVFSTTHATRFSFGGEFTGETLREAGRLVASYCSAVCHASSLADEAVPFDRRPLGLVMKDIRSDALYARGDLGTLQAPWAGAVALILANVNFVSKVLRAIVGEDSSSFTKLRVMTAFHAIESLRIVQDRLHAERLLPKRAADVIGSVASPEVRWLRKHGALRDMLVHFQAHQSRSSPHAWGYQEQLTALAGGKSEAELGNLADRVLATVGRVLASGFDLHAQTFWYGTVQG